MAPKRDQFLVLLALQSPAAAATALGSRGQRQPAP
jgi:hypothetical protein